MGVPAGGHPADDLVGVPDRLVADDVGRIVRIGLYHQGHQPPGRADRRLRFERRPPDEVVVQLHDVGHPRLKRGIDGTVLAEPRAVALLESKRQERPDAEQAQAMGLTEPDEAVEQRPLVLRCHPQLIAKLARVGEPTDLGGDHPDVHAADIHEPERLRAHIRRGHRGQHVARSRAGQPQPDEVQPDDLERNVATDGQVIQEPTLVVRLAGERSEQGERLHVRPGDGELPDDPARLVEHRRQADPAHRRQAIREEPRQPGRGACAGHPVLRKVGDLDEADAFADGGTFGGDLRPGIRSTERHILDGWRPRCPEPEGMLKPEGRAPHRVGRRQAVVDRCRQERSRGRQLLVRERDPETPGVILADLRVRVAEGRVGPVPGDIHAEDVHPGVPLGHPARKGESDPAALRQAGHDRTGDPVVA